MFSEHVYSDKTSSQLRTGVWGTGFQRDRCQILRMEEERSLLLGRFTLFPLIPSKTAIFGTPDGVLRARNEGSVQFSVVSEILCCHIIDISVALYYDIFTIFDCFCLNFNFLDCNTDTLSTKFSRRRHFQKKLGQICCPILKSKKRQQCN